MDTLPTDLIGLVRDYTHLHEDIVLGFQHDRNNLDLKWFLYKRYRGLHCGLELVDLVKRKGLPLLKYFNEYPGDIECEDSYVYNEILKLAFYYRMSYKDIFNLKYAISKIQHFSIFDICREAIKYDEYKDVGLYPNMLPKKTKKNLDNNSEIYEHEIIINAYKTHSEISRARVQEILDNYNSIFGRGLLKAIATQDNVKFKTLIKKHLKTTSPDILVNYIIKDVSFTRALTVEMFETFCSAFPKIHKYIPSPGDILDLNIDLFESVVIKYNLNTKEIVQLAYQVGYEGPLWQKIVNETPDILSYIDLRVYGNEKLAKIKLSMLKIILEHDKPSRRELLSLINHLSRYDIQMYLFELLYDR